jgi:predicted DNA-binding protein YlxM (UPF0122 family)
LSSKLHENIDAKRLTAKNEIRDRIDLLESRVELLSGRDRLLMTMYVQNGNSFRQMARLAGVNEATIARRIHRVTKRLLDGEYITCLRNRGKLTRQELAIAKDYFLEGLSQGRIAQKRGWSVYSVRQSLKKIQEIVKVPKNRGEKGERFDADFQG